MRVSPSMAVMSLAFSALCALSAGCDRRKVPAAGESATTGAHVSIEPVGADASTTSAALPVETTVREQPPLAPVRDGGGAAANALRTSEESDAAAVPRWVPKDATLSIIASGDRDRNLGIVTPSRASGPSKMTVDAGGVAVDIEIHSRP